MPTSSSARDRAASSSRGDFGTVGITSQSGSIRVAVVAEADLRTVSGVVEVDECEGRCRVSTTSGRITVGATRDAEISTTSGIGRCRRRDGGRPGAIGQRHRHRRLVGERACQCQHRLRLDHDPPSVRGAPDGAVVGPRQGAEQLRSGRRHRRRHRQRERHGPARPSLMAAPTRRQSKTVEGTIVFTDIVGFTEFTATRGDAEALQLLATQDRLVQSALPTGRASSRSSATACCSGSLIRSAPCTASSRSHRGFEAESVSDRAPVVDPGRDAPRHGARSVAPTSSATTSTWRRGSSTSRLPARCSSPTRCEPEWIRARLTSASPSWDRS